MYWWVLPVSRLLYQEDTSDLQGVDYLKSELRRLLMIGLLLQLKTSINFQVTFFSVPVLGNPAETRGIG